MKRTNTIALVVVALACSVGGLYAFAPHPPAAPKTLQDRAEYKKLNFKPGERAVYSNLNYMVLSAVIEAVSGQSYESYSTENILQPLGMTQTAFVYSAEMTGHEAVGTLPVVHFYTPLMPLLVDTSTLIRQRQSKFFWFNRVYIDATPSTGLIGSAPHVARLMLAYLKCGETILSPKSVVLMTQTALLDEHGLSWFVSPNPDDFYLEHTGGLGFATFMRLYPQKGLGVAVLASGTDLDYAGLANLLGRVDW